MTMEKGVEDRGRAGAAGGGWGLALEAVGVGEASRGWRSERGDPPSERTTASTVFDAFSGVLARAWIAETVAAPTARTTIAPASQDSRLGRVTGAVCDGGDDSPAQAE